ncbi:D-mannonate oxidoreductase [Roseibium sp. TrichSKD4]|uniref:mannitol dehydrogenase family protein n=1 Tax=Roseibium sp. TrichSKD4 TaxID=744980 RepID=UPI0001E56E8A|nr:mannitol dehydrogenase family protein [Roseibium sp. TrichSKD4]EFO32033.1 D-mannonate oxidoreductase [Roseibium sp. TrichSKD4]
MPPSLFPADYDRSRLKPRIMHIGFGAFAKAHVCVFHDEMLRKSQSDWGMVVCRLNSGEETLTKLDKTHGLFTVGEMADDDLHLRRVGAVIKTLHPRRDGTNALLGQLADPDLQVVTLTITEKGYCLSKGHLDTNNPAIVADLKTPNAPKTAIGILVESLRLRSAAQNAGLTILSCDNLPANGQLCQTTVLEYANKIDPELADWISTNCTFPCSMVDRITPAMTEESNTKMAIALGSPDPNGVFCEQFRQWVVEDNFAAMRPDWNLGGVELVRDVEPYEDLKLRLLNGTHSFLAYLGALDGKETIAECMTDTTLRSEACNLMQEQAKSLSMPDNVDVPAYIDALMERFSNRALQHKTTQIAADGTQKLPQRLLAPIKFHLKAKRPWPLAALGIAGWMQYCRGRSEAGHDLPLNDQLADKISEIAAQNDKAEYVRQLLSLEMIFAPDLVANPIFTETIQGAFETLSTKGVQTALAEAN